MVRQWTKKNRDIDLHVSEAYLVSAVKSFGNNFFQKPLSVPTWEELARIDKGFVWGLFLEQPQNLFNE